MLKISDPDISCTELTDYGKDAFLKLPLQGYLDAIDITPVRPQIALINAINNPKYRFITCCFSRRVGKTYITNIIGQVKLLEPGTTVLLIAPDYSLASISWDLQQGFIKQFELETEKNNAKDRVIVLSNGSMIRVASVLKVDSAVGRSYDLVIFDEAAIEDKGGSAFNIQLRPTLDKENSKAVFISTPRGNNWFQEFFLRGIDPSYPDWVSIHADYHENPRLSSKDVESARRAMSEAEFQQEYEANFSVFEGQIWNFKPEYIQDLQSLRHTLHKVDVIGGLDIGFRDDTAMAVIVCVEGDPDAVYSSGNPDWDKRKDMYYILDEYLQNGVSTETIATNIKVLEEENDIDFIFIDSAAQQMRFDLAQLYDVTTMNAKKDRLAGIGFVSALVDNGQLIVDENCIHCVYSLMNYKWDNKSQIEKPEHGKASHMADAIRYALYTYASGMMNFS